MPPLIPALVFRELHNVRLIIPWVSLCEDSGLSFRLSARNDFSRNSAPLQEAIGILCVPTAELWGCPWAELVGLMRVIHVASGAIHDPSSHSFTSKLVTHWRISCWEHLSHSGLMNITLSNGVFAAANVFPKSSLQTFILRMYLSSAWSYVYYVSLQPFSCQR